MLTTNLKLAFRNLTKNKGFSLINIFGLAVGMAVTILIALWIYDEMSFNTYHPATDRFVRIRTNFTQNNEVITAYNCGQPLANELRNNYAENFESVALAFNENSAILSHKAQKATRHGLFTHPQFLDMAAVELTMGNPATVLESVNSMIISASTATFLFADRNPMGQIIRMDNDKDYQVTGIFKDFPKNSTFAERDFVLPWSALLSQDWVSGSVNNWGNLSFTTYATLRSGATAATASKSIENVLDDKWSAHFQPTVFAQPMSDWYLYDNFKNGQSVGGRIDMVRLFGIIGIFVLILACINFINLSTAQSEKRAKEVGVRKTIGSSKTALILQFLTESYVVVGIALVIALGLVYTALEPFNEIADKSISLPWSNVIFWLSILFFSLCTGLLAGSYPAFYLSSFRPLQVLQGLFKGGSNTGFSRKALVIVQFSVSITLIIGTLVVFQQINHAKSRSVGYNRSNVLQIDTFTDELSGFENHNTLRNQLLATGVVEEVSISNTPITNVWSTQGGFQWEGSDPESPASFAFVTGTHEFGKVAEWNLTAGRNFSRQIATDTSTAIINQVAADLMGFDDPIGKTIRNGDGNYRIIGVVENMLMESPYQPMRPTIYSIDYNWRNALLVRIKDNANTQLSLQKIEGVLAELDPAAPFNYNFVDENFDRKFKSEVRIGTLARIFAILAIFISCLGLFGLSAYVAERRAKEIGIRKVLGASVLDLWAMLSKDFIYLVIISAIVAVPIAWYYLSGWLNSYEYRIELSSWVFILTGILAVAVTLTTVSFQSIRAALANPIQSLKDE